MPPSISPEKILVIIPTFNERENIATIIPAVKKQLQGCHILVVDDNSPDKTAEIIQNMQKEDTDLHLLQRSEKSGLGKAYLAGFSWALQREYTHIFQMDADFSHEPRFLPDFINAVEDADLVIGSRYISGVNVINWSMSRLLLSYFANVYARIITGCPITDATGGFKCFRREVIESLDFKKIGSSGYSFQIEVNFLSWKKGFRLKEIPIVFTDRQFGVSKMSSGIIKEALLLLFKLRVKTLFIRKW